MTIIKDIQSICQRSRATLFHDAVGVAALGVLLIASLHLPSLS
ncbi:MAG: hypothetical protein AAF754_02135 [Pseudomonadota bacterium]